ncbi:MAG: gliding motility-associated C-terminal domain-containing protein [Bacteroidia bacterium]|nr:gliding motility-associated C-terminal domain-containing protein [Bacteroidia bacterium]
MSKAYQIFIVCFLFSINSFASHIAGGSITYKLLEKDLYEIKLTLYRDCGGIAVANSETVTITNACGVSENISLPFIPVLKRNISMVCASRLDSTNCDSSSYKYQGFTENVYMGTYKLNGKCSEWIFTWTQCCRNISANIADSSNANITLKSTLNNLTSVENNSVKFIDPFPIPLICTNDSSVLTMGGIDEDDDSLNYSLVAALGLNGAALQYAAGFSATSPIPGITIDQNTGKISFKLPQARNYVIAIKVSEYNRKTGVLKGYVYRDIMITGKSCTNSSPYNNSGIISSFSGSGTSAKIDPYTITLCQFDTINFSMQFADPNAQDSLSFVNNIHFQLPGAIVTKSGKNPLTVNVRWVALSGTSNQNINLVITVKDNVCPYLTAQNYVYRIKIKPGANAGKDKLICLGDTARLNGTGGNTYTWSVIQGSSLNVGQNIQCINCANPWVKPTQTTTYLLETNVPTNGCFYKDTVKITVVPTFTPSVSPINPSVCAGTTLPLAVNCTPAGTYTYTWVPGLRLSSGNINNPNFSYSVAGTYSYSVIVNNNQGCTKTVNLSVENKPLPVVSISPSTAAAVCSGSSIGLSATTGLASYTWSPSTGLSNTNTASVTANPTATTTYNLTVSDANACKQTISKTVTVNPLPVVTVSPTTATICSDSTLRLTVSGAKNYTWLPMPTGDMFKDTVYVRPTVNTTYTVVGKDAKGCSSPIIIPVTVTTAPSAMITVDSSICLNNIKTLIATVAPIYSWFANNQYLSSNQSISVEPLTTTNYKLVTYTAGKSCHSANSITLNKVTNLIYDTTLIVCSGYATTLFSPINYIEHKWTPFYNINDTSSINPEVWPQKNTLYNCLLKDNNGCLFTANYTVKMDSVSECNLKIYNAITLNDDGINDQWFIDGIDDKSNEVFIANMWGDLIWKTKNYNNHTNYWNGKNSHGKKVPDGTYFYQIDTGSKHYKGQIELISKP